MRRLPNLTLILLGSALALVPADAQPVGREPTGPQPTLRGFFFNPWVNDQVRGFAWLMRSHEHGTAIDRELTELVARTGINFIDIQILIPRTLARVKQAPAEDARTIDQWADMKYF